MQFDLFQPANAKTVAEPMPMRDQAYWIGEQAKARALRRQADEAFTRGDKAECARLMVAALDVEQQPRH